jgi:thiamine-phosphate pyrophosphorylase
MIGQSTHSEAEIAAAEQSADYVTFGPIFFTPSKASFGEPLGLSRLANASKEFKIPIFALGGVEQANAARCVKSGARGIAAIRMFMEAEEPKEAVLRLANVMNVTFNDKKS